MSGIHGMAYHHPPKSLKVIQLYKEIQFDLLGHCRTVSLTFPCGSCMGFQCAILLGHVVIILDCTAIRDLFATFWQTKFCKKHSNPSHDPSSHFLRKSRTKVWTQRTWEILMHYWSLNTNVPETHKICVRTAGSSECCQPEWISII